MIKLEKEDIEEMRQQLKDEDDDFTHVDAGDVRIIRDAIIQQIGYNNDILKIKTLNKYLEIKAFRSCLNKITRLINAYNQIHLIKRVYFDSIYIYIEFDENLVYAVRKPHYYD